jgi:hypothetical protein
MGQYIIAYDLGTGGNKASLYDEEGNCLVSTFVPYETIYPRAGWHEQCPMDWWNAVEPTKNDPLFIPHLAGRVCPGQPYLRGSLAGVNVGSFGMFRVSSLVITGILLRLILESARHFLSSQTQALAYERRV